MKRILLLSITALITCTASAQNFSINADWTNSYYPKNFNNDLLRKTIVDKSGNIYISGISGGLGTGNVTYFSKLTGTGQVVWLKIIEKVAGNMIMTLDSTDNFYCAILDSNNQLKRYFVPRDSVAGGFDYPYTVNSVATTLIPSAMAISSNGVQYIAGKTAAGKFAFTNNVWMRTDTFGTADHILTDTLGNAYVYGSRLSGNALRKYDAAGNLLFSFTVPNSNDTNSGTWTYSHLQYPYLYITVAGNNRILKFNAVTGTLMQSAVLTFPVYDQCARRGNTFFALTNVNVNYPGNGTRDRSIFFSFDTLGNIMWADTFENYWNGNSFSFVNLGLNSLYFDSTGIYVEIHRGGNADSATIAKFAFNGSRLWTKKIKWLMNASGAQPFGMGSNIVFVYQGSDPANGSMLDVNFTSFDKPTGTVNGQTNYQAPPIAWVIPRSIAKDKYGNTYFTGGMITNGLWFMVLQKADAMGNVIWTQTDTGGGTELLIDTVHDKIFVLGGTMEISPNPKLKVWKYDLNGNLEVEANYPNNISYDDLYVAFDSNKDIYVLGPYYPVANTGNSFRKISNSDLSELFRVSDVSTVVHGLYVTPSNNILVCRSNIACYSPTGTLLFNNSVSSSLECTFDPNKNEWLGFHSSGTLNFRKGNFVNDTAKVQVIGSVSPLSLGSALNWSLDSSGNAYVLVYVSAQGIYLIKVGPTLDTILWEMPVPYFGNISPVNVSLNSISFQNYSKLYIENGKNPLVVFNHYSTDTIHTLPFYDIDVLLFDTAGNIKAAKTLDNPMHLSDNVFGSYFDSKTNRLTLAGPSDFRTGYVSGMCYSLAIQDPDFHPVVPNCNAAYTLYPDTTTPHNWWAVNQATGTGPLTYTWYWGDGASSTGATPSHTYATAGNYNICLTIADSTGCADTYCDSSTYIYKTEGIASVTVVWQIPAVTGIQQSTNAVMHLQVYPNPATNQLNINLGGLQAEQVSIYNVDGKLLSQTKQPANNRIDISNLASGAYIAEVKLKDVVQRVRWVKM